MDPRIGVGRLYLDWLDMMEGQGLAERTVDMYSYGVWRLHKHARKTTPEITAADVGRFLRSLGTRSSARKLYFDGIRSFLRFADRRDAIPEDPTAFFKIKRPKRRPQVRLEEDELLRFLIAAWRRDPRRAWTLLLSFSLGTRRMEVAGIRPDDLLEDGRVILHGKGDKERIVTLSPLAEIALAELRPLWNGTILGGADRSTVTQWAHEAAVDSGLYPKIQGRVSHCLRASFISYQLSRGVPVHVVRDIVGHESIATTNDYAVAADIEGRTAMRTFTLAPRRENRA